MDTLMDRHHVVTTISPSTAVTCAAKGPFIQPGEDNLIVCKGSTIEVYTVMLDGIKSFMEFNIYGTIRNMQVIQLSDKTTCSLFILTVHQCYTILTYSSKTQSIVTEFSGMLDITSARETDQPIVVTVDTSSETLFVSAFTGYLIAIPYGKPDSSIKMTTKNRDSKALRFMPVPIRTNEFDFLSVATLQQASYASVLVGELEDLKTIKTFKYCEGPKELVEKKNMAMKVEATTHTLVTVPAPLGGMLAIGEYVITYYDPFSNTVRELSIEPVLVTAWEYLSDGSNRFLLGDSEGYLYMFILETGHNKVVNLSSTLIGQVVRPNCIIDLGNYMFYIGSTHGDSCLIQLINAATPSKYSIRVLANYSCLGPIVDFCLFDYNEQGKQTMACCSGVDNDASIRIVENGIGFIKQAVLDFPLVYNMWPLKLEEQSDSLLITTALETILLKPLRDADNQFMEYASYSGLCTNETTLASGLWNDHIVQITPSSARLMTKDEHGTLLAEWKPPRNKRISMAKLKESYCLVCDEDDIIVYLEIVLNTFIERSTTQVRNTSCMSISTCKENGTDNNYVVIGTFGSGSNIRLLQLPELQMIYEHVNTPITASPKDVLIVFMEGLLYLMVMLGDGQILSYCIKHLGSEHIMLYDERQMMVSTYCTGMYPYQYQGEQKIFVAGQKPSVISSFNQTLFVYSVNLTNIYTLTAYNDILALMTDHQLLFGKTDVVSKLQHTKYDIPGEMPLRVEYLSRTKALAVGSSTYIRDTNKNVMERTGKVRILDAQTFQVLDTYELGNNEIVESMCVARFKEYPDKEYLFVGTLIENQLDPNNNSGRILAFTIDGFKCELLDAIDMPGVIYRMEAVENTVIAAVDGKLYGLCKLQPDLLKGERIEFKFLLHHNVVALDMDSQKDLLLVGDLMESMSLLKVNNNPDALGLDLLATDNKQVWITAVKFVNEGVMIGADDRQNLFTMVKPSPQNGRGLAKLELEGGYHLGTLVNRFRKDILRDMTSVQDNISVVARYGSEFTFVTVNGSIGTVKSISKESFDFFKGIQDGILKILPNVGNLDHSLWRTYKPKHKITRTNDNYLDGDILKLYTQMNLIEKQKLLEQYQNVSIKDLEEWIHHLIS